MFDDRIADDLALFDRQFVVEPVVTHCHGQGHFRRVQKMFWMPIFEVGNADHFINHALAKLWVRCKGMCQSHREDVVHRIT